MKYLKIAGGLGILWLAATVYAAGNKAVDKGLLAYLPLRKDLADHSAANNPVRVNGKVELRDGAAYFNGGTNWLILPHFDFYEKPFAVSMWIKTTGVNPMYGLLEQKAENSPGCWLHIMLRGAWQPYLGFYINDAISPQDLTVGEWAHVIFQYNGTHQQLWVNDELLCSRRASPYEGNSGETVIGRSPRWNNVPSKDFEGYLRDVRIYSHALSANEVTALFELENGTGPDAVARPSGTPRAPSRGEDQAKIGIPLLAIDGAKLVITGESRQVFDILATSDLNSAWQPLVTLTNATGVVEFTDGDAGGVSQRFYRIRVR